MKIMGIDPGKKGGIAVIDSKRKICELTPMPMLPGGKVWDLEELCVIVGRWSNDCGAVYIEKVGAMPGQGVVSMFNFGWGCGALEGIVAAYQLPYHKVSPQTWMKSVHQGSDAKANTKQKGLQIAKRLYPGRSFLATPRSRVPHDGMVDALLIALFGLQQYGKGV